MTLNQQKIYKNAIIASLESETMGKLINKIPGSWFLIQSLPGYDLRMLVESLGKLAMSTSILKALPGKLDMERFSPSIFYIYVESHEPTCISLFYVDSDVCITTAFM